MTNLVISGIVAGALVGVAASAQATPQKIGMARARTTALKLAPGTITDAEYEKENGGWRYSFDIQQGARIHEIGVDAFTGKVVENDFENPRAHD